MPLRLSLKPQERVIIGGAVVRNGDSRTEIFVENQIPILREADILSPSAVKTPCERVYLAVQLMYVDQEHETPHRRFYEELVSDVVEAAPSTKRFLDEVDEHVSKGEFYQALKSTKTLLDYEQELLSRGTQSD